MAIVLQLVNGRPKMVDLGSISLPTIYDEEITIVASSPGSNELVGPISSGTNVTIPGAATYSSSELEVVLNGQVLNEVTDYNYIGSPPRTQVSFNLQLEVGDIINFRKVRDQ